MLHIFLSPPTVSLSVQIVQINPSTPSQIHSAPDSHSFRFSAKIFRLSALDERPEKFFSPGPEPAVDKPVTNFVVGIGTIMFENPKLFPYTVKKAF